MWRESLSWRGRFGEVKELDSSRGRGRRGEPARGLRTRKEGNCKPHSGIFSKSTQAPLCLDTPPKARPPSYLLVEISDPESELKEPRGPNPLPPTSSCQRGEKTSCLAPELPRPRRWPPATRGYLHSTTITEKLSSSATLAACLSLQ